MMQNLVLKQQLVEDTIIRLINNSIIVGKIKNIYGILNGTCNYILTKMRENNLQFNKALKRAQN